MTLFFKRAILDILNNRFLNIVTITTITLSILIISTFILFYINANDIINSWKKGIRLMAYLGPEFAEESVPDLQNKIMQMYGVRDVRFISKEEALTQLKKQMKRQSSLFENLKKNPLPDAFEIRMLASSQSWDKVESLASQSELLPKVNDVEYGQRWLGRFVNIFNLFKLTGYAIGVLFCMATVFIVANTTRLVLYSRREELEIMRLVGAEDSFIKAPFYIEGLIQGASGGILGFTVLFIMYLFISSNIEQGLSSGLFTIRFISLKISCIIILCSMFVGWAGCYFSLKQFLKN